MMRPELVVDSRCVIGEGPVWDSASGKLYFIDNRTWRLYCWNGSEIENTMYFDKNVGFVVVREGGGLVAGLKDGYYFVDFDDPEPKTAALIKGKVPERFNDGKVDPAGRLWGDTMPLSLDTGEGEVGPDSAVYCMDGDRKVKTMLEGVIQGNGLGWTKDAKKFYFIDTMRFCVQEFDYDIASNTLSNGRVCVEIPQEVGIPDGMTVDDEGMIWVALWGGHAVMRYDPATGALLERVEIPAPNVTSCCFGGEKLDELYITTASYGTDMEQYPHAGGVFKIRPGVTGQPSYRFKG